MFCEDVLILTEGSSIMGMGHIMRCLSLYEEMVKRGKRVRILINGDGSINLPDITYTLTDFRTLDADVFHGKYVVLDSYHTTDMFIEKLSEQAKCLFIDDLGKDYPAGFVVNPTFYGIPYKDNDDIHFLVGKDYVIVRKEFTYGAKTSISKDINEITIIIGGTDVLSLSYSIYKSLKQIPIRKNIIIGKGHKDYRAISEGADDMTNVLSDLNAHKLKDVFLQSDLVITAGGQTCNELIALNVPFVAICVIDNQKTAVSEMVKAGMTVDVKAYEVEGVISDVVRGLSYNERLKFFNAMQKYDFSRGVQNIIDAYLE